MYKGTFTLHTMECDYDNVIWYNFVLKSHYNEHDLRSPSSVHCIKPLLI